MSAKTKKYIEYGAIGVGIIILIWLITRSSLVNPSQSSSQLPSVPGGGSIGGNTYNGGNIVIPPLPGVTLPSITLPGSENGQGCCASCGCDPGSNNPFAASVAGLLSNYQSAISAQELAYNQALFGSMPIWLAQYITTADPNGNNSIVGP